MFAPSFLLEGGWGLSCVSVWGEGRRGSASGPLKSSHSSSVCRGAGKRRNALSQSMDPSGHDGWCKYETMSPVLLPSPGLFTVTLLWGVIVHSTIGTLVNLLLLLRLQGLQVTSFQQMNFWTDTKEKTDDANLGE